MKNLYEIQKALVTSNIGGMYYDELAKANLPAGGIWRTINGAKVYIHDGKIIAGAGGNIGSDSKSDSGGSKSPEDSSNKTPKEKLKDFYSKNASESKNIEEFTAKVRTMKDSGGMKDLFMKEYGTKENGKPKDLGQAIEDLFDDLKGKVKPEDAINPKTGKKFALDPEVMESLQETWSEFESKTPEVKAKIEKVISKLSKEQIADVAGADIKFLSSAAKDHLSGKKSEDGNKGNDGLKEKVDYFDSLDQTEQKEYLNTLKNEWIPETEKDLKNAKSEGSKKVYQTQLDFLKNKLLPAVTKGGNNSKDGGLESDLKEKFGDAAKKAKTPKEFYDSVKSIKGISPDLSSFFQEKYGKGKDGKRLTMEQSAENLWNDLKGSGGSDEAEKKIAEKLKKDPEIVIFGVKGSDVVKLINDPSSTQKWDNDYFEKVDAVLEKLKKTDF